MLVAEFTGGSTVHLHGRFLGRIDEVVMLDANMQPVTASFNGSHSGPITELFVGAEFASVKARNGVELLFEVMTASATNPPYDPLTACPTDGRLIKATDPSGDSFEIAYKPITQAEIDQSPDRQWLMDTISDSTGLSLSLQYHPLQQSGQWAISSVTLPGGDQIQYAYQAGFGRVPGDDHFPRWCAVRKRPRKPWLSGREELRVFRACSFLGGCFVPLARSLCSTALDRSDQCV
ncbi:MAG: hypothetical protein AAFP69_21650 [Planctomycetota bacterium]